jgi:phage gp46-like protein
MPDITTRWDTSRFRGDWALLPPALLSECDLFTSVLISLFTHRRALDDDVLPDDLTGPGLPEPIRQSGDRRGWWADSFLPQPIGSRLWLLSREKQMQSVVSRAKLYAEEALAWLVDDGVAERVGVNPFIPREEWLALEIKLYRPKKPTFAIRFDWAWQGLEFCLPAEGSGAPPPAAKVAVTFDSTRVDFSLTSLNFDLTGG